MALPAIDAEVKDGLLAKACAPTEVTELGMLMLVKFVSASADAPISVNPLAGNTTLVTSPLLDVLGFVFAKALPAIDVTPSGIVAIPLQFPPANAGIWGPK